MDATDERFMMEALSEAERSVSLNEFPVGAVVVLGSEIVGRGSWAGPARLLDHAEIVALMEAERSRVLRRNERRAATLYATPEPCALCMAASMSFLLGRVVYALEAPVDGGTNLPNLWHPANGHPQDGIPYTIPDVVGGVGRDASIALIAEWLKRNSQYAWASAYIPQ